MDDSDALSLLARGCPSVPATFVDPARMQVLSREIKGFSGGRRRGGRIRRLKEMGVLAGRTVAVGGVTTWRRI